MLEHYIWDDADENKIKSFNYLPVAAQKSLDFSSEHLEGNVRARMHWGIRIISRGEMHFEQCRRRLLDDKSQADASSMKTDDRKTMIYSGYLES